MAETPVQYQREKQREGKVPVSSKIFQGFGCLSISHKTFVFNNRYTPARDRLPAIQAELGRG